ncbi:MAG: Dabb family protein [Lachnospiraceae bacterium]|nr:Dabb family protein [Lachnospiraceae bacterium]
MIKHVILWKIKEEISLEEKEQIKEGIKLGLEGLIDKVPGIVEIKVNTKGLPSSNADVMLDSTFESEEALKNYATHPEHVKVADNNVRPYMEVRMCMDYEV